LAKQFQRRRFLEIDQSKTRIACGSHVCLMDQNEISNLGIAHSILIRLQTWPSLFLIGRFLKQLFL
jgi:hypothetical protein